MVRSTACLVALVLLTGCGGEDSIDDPPAASVTPPLTTPRTTPASDVAADAAPVELPASYPSDVPVPADVELDNAEEHVGASSTIYEITGWYDGDPIRVARDYERVLKDLGYEITSRTESPDNVYFVAENDTWYISAGFFPDPIRNVGASVGVTVAPAG